MLKLGPISQFLAALGAVAGGGVVLGSLLGGVAGFLHGADRTETLEHAGIGGLTGAALALAILAAERIPGL